MLSIIIPIYNAEKFLAECIESLIGQDYEDKEILLIDDGSTDNSSNICDNYANKYNFIRTYHKANAGSSSARNKGIELSKGNYIAFVDADDVLDSDFYSILIKAIEDTKADIAACSYVNEYKSKITVKAKNNQIPKPIIFNDRNKALESMTEKQNSIEGFVWNKVWKRSVIEGIKFREDISIIEDALFTWNVVKKTTRVVYIGLPMYHYRILKTSVTRNSSLDKYYQAINAYKIMIRDANNIAPRCLDGLITDYIIWNIKAAENLLLSKSKIVNDDYKIIKRNLIKYYPYIAKCGIRHKILATALLQSWNLYRFWGKLFLYIKILYLKVK